MPWMLEENYRIGKFEFGLSVMRPEKKQVRMKLCLLCKKGMKIMTTKFDELKGAFREYFAQKYHYKKDLKEHFNEGDGWVYAVVPGAGTERIHFELIRYGEDCFVELHVEMASRNVAQWLELRRVLDADRRHLLHYSYYSSNYWRTRNPVQKREDLTCDLDRMVSLIVPVFSTVDERTLTAGKREGGGLEPLPFQKNPREVSKMLDDGVLRLPAVQRGKVWNAARVESLWDSIFRGFSIGAFSVQNMNDGLDLLDGQQRSSAVSMGYAPFPPVCRSDETESKHELDSILWIDIAPDAQTLANSPKKFMFHVTTASQPWGYAASSDETRNVLLSASEKRDALAGLEWHDFAEKPYPGELIPFRAKSPVPFTLLRQFLEEVDASEDANLSVGQFVEWCCTRRADTEGGNDTVCWWNWLDRLLRQHESGALGDCRMWYAIIHDSTRDATPVGRIAQLDNYPIFFIDAGSIADYEIALYFTRVGKGGVRPSDEELAYSVLKSHLGKRFRDSIEKIYAEYGLAQPSRIAHLAIRCFRSRGNVFSSAPVLDEALNICRCRDDGEGEPGRNCGKEVFLRFVCDGEFAQLIQKVDEEAFRPSDGLTQWHRTRFCQYHNGDIYLFMLLAARDDLLTTKNRRGVRLASVAELLYERALNPDRAIRYILQEGVQEGLAHSMREVYRGVTRLALPPSPDAVWRFANSVVSRECGLRDVRARAESEGLSGMISNGYGNSRAYGMLLYACKSETNNFFRYDPNMGIWAEDNCPWDYDHILPHSWIDNMDGDLRDICQWLKNSIGNLAPLPFEMNRSLSDRPRDRFYPYCGRSGKKCCASNVQRDYCLDGDAIELMRDFDKNADGVFPFVAATVKRFARIYEKWYYGLSYDKLLDFSSVKAMEGGAGNRYRILQTVLEQFKVEEVSVQYYTPDGTRHTVGESHPVESDWYIWEWVSLFINMNKMAIELCFARDGQSYQIGVGKLVVGGDDALPENAAALFANPGIDGWEKTDDDSYWYYYKKGFVEGRSGDSIPESVVNEFRRLLEISKKLEFD